MPRIAMILMRLASRFPASRPFPIVAHRISACREMSSSCIPTRFTMAARALTRACTIECSTSRRKKRRRRDITRCPLPEMPSSRTKNSGNASSRHSAISKANRTIYFSPTGNRDWRICSGNIQTEAPEPSSGLTASPFCDAGTICWRIAPTPLVLKNWNG
ncbi:hypothetical protein D3C71_1525170 [compost metagenome]